MINNVTSATTYHQATAVSATLFPDLPARDRFHDRLSAAWPRLFTVLATLYGERADFTDHLRTIVTIAAQAAVERPEDLLHLDERPADWFQSERMLGAVCYVDRYAGTLAGLRARIPYFRELGLTYLHLMPLYRSPPGPNDGGYAVSDFRTVDPTLGTMAELADLARELRGAGISLVLDFVMNHTADDHAWAMAARDGDPHRAQFYWCFPDRTLPDAYERHLREVFPDQAPGNFTYVPAMDRWVWTTFNRFQWDLNYSNPAVFGAMLGELLFLANQGAEVLRLDAVPFIWKALGTNCENLPGAHLVIEAMRLLAGVVAPALLFKSEAIVHPDDVMRFIGAECSLSYNPLLMVLLWEAVATGDVEYLRVSLAKRFALPAGTAWVNYVRSHDDIGWGFADEDARLVGLDGPALRQQLNAFFTNQAPQSFARGLPFNHNPRTGDMRISGTTASLAGLEAASHKVDSIAIDRAIDRITLIMGMTLAAAGIPLLYLGDELGMMNDYRYALDAALADDNRWVHRPRFDPVAFAARHDLTTIPGRIFAAIRRMIAARQAHAVFAGTNATEWLASGNPQILAMRRTSAEATLLVLGNFSDQPQSATWSDLLDAPTAVNLLAPDHRITPTIILPPYGQVWLKREIALHIRS